MDIYETCIKLRQAGDDASLRKLLDTYLSTIWFSMFLVCSTYERHFVSESAV